MSTVKVEKQTKRYIVQRTLGKGAFGTVYLVKEDKANNIYAVKETLQNSKYKNRESEILKYLKHPAIVKVFQMFYSQKKDGTYLNIVMEYLPSSLHDVINQFREQKTCIPENDIRYYMFQLCRACAYLSRHNICHRDIKPQNILVDPIRHIIRLCDFGSAKILTDGEWNKHYICSRFYRAPELLCESNSYSTTVDIWSLGCVMAEMYLGEPLFKGSNTREQLQLISEILGPIPLNYPICDDKIHIEPTKDWTEILNEYYDCASQEAGDYISCMLCYNPEDRIDLMESLFHSYCMILTQPYTNNKIYQHFPKLEWIEDEIPIIERLMKKYNLSLSNDNSETSNDNVESESPTLTSCNNNDIDDDK